MSCLDKISNVIVNSLAGDNSPLVVIVNEELVFTTVVASLAGTNYYAPVTYHWDFGNGHTEVSSESSITYSYSTPGLWTVTLKATNNVSSAVFSGIVKISKGWLYCLCRLYGNSFIQNITKITVRQLARFIRFHRLSS